MSTSENRQSFNLAKVSRYTVVGQTYQVKRRQRKTKEVGEREGEKIGRKKVRKKKKKGEVNKRKE